MINLLNTKTKLKRAICKGAVASLSVLALGVVGSPAYANLVVNGSFDTASTSSFVATSATIAPWTVTSTAFTTSPLTCVDVYTAGNICGSSYIYPDATAAHLYVTPVPLSPSFLISDADRSASQVISQTLTGLVPGKTYTVSFEQAGANLFPNGSASTEYWSVELGGVIQTSHVMSSPAGGDYPFELQTLSFVATTATDTLSFLAQGTPVGGPPMALLDNVDVEVAVPEPATLALLGLAVVGLIGIYKTRMSSTAAV